ncbi:tRNA lysidine(34) synthetase TilS [Candidatus Vidania fulgoroideorum]
MKKFSRKDFIFLISKNINEKIAISYSGGLDSNILLEICKKFYNNIILIHINHKNKNSNKIEKKCIKISKINKVFIINRKIKIKKKIINKIGLEAFYRKQRYKEIFKVMKNNNIKKLLIAHTLDDMIETYLINITRGTGVSGVCSIRENRKINDIYVLRPILYYDRFYLIKKFIVNKSLISHDDSNLNLYYKRNYIRNFLNNFNIFKLFNFKILNYFKNSFNEYKCLKDIAKIDIFSTKMIIKNILKLKDFRIFNMLNFFFKKKNFLIPSKSWLIELLKQMKSKSNNFIIKKNNFYIIKKKKKLFCNKIKILVNKFGGKSLESYKKIFKIIKNLKKKIEIGYKIIVILSAQGNETDKLYKEYKKYTKGKTFKKFEDLYIATGEIKSVSLFCQISKNLNIRSDYMMSWQIPILSSGKYSNSSIKNINKFKILKKFIIKDMIVIPGFQSVDKKKNIKTLGRGGSDYTAIEICKYLQIKKCYFYKEVKGIYNMDPNKFNYCKLLKKINYLDILESSSLGSKILQLNCVVSIIRNGIISYIIRSKKKFLNMKKENNSGTLISYEKLKKKHFFVNFEKCFLNYLKVKNTKKIKNILKNLKKKNIKIDNIIIYRKKNYFFEFTTLNKINNIGIKKLKYKKYIKLYVFGIGINNYNNNLLKILYYIKKIGFKIYSFSNSEMCLKFIFKLKFKKKILLLVKYMSKMEI